MKLILGSSSPFRRKVMQDAQVCFESISPGIDEKKIRAINRKSTPLLLSFAKAQAVARRIKEPAIIIGCDQVIFCAGNMMEKPENASQIRSWYRMYSYSLVIYYNGFTVLNTETGVSLSAMESSIVRFSSIPDDFVEEQINKGVIFNCSGGLGDETEDAYGNILEGSKQSLKGMPLKFIVDMVGKVR
jgi:septum formation protein